MTKKLEELQQRSEAIKAEIGVLAAADVEAVIAGADPANSAEVLRLTQDLNIVHTALDRLRGDG